MLNRFLNWLLANRWVNFVILMVYFIIAVLPHEEIGLLISSIFSPYTLDSYNRVILIFVACAIIIYLFIVFKLFKEISYQAVFGFYAINFVLAILCFKILFVLNIEAIHFLQYGIFALLCFPLLRNYSLTLVYTTIAGSIDEAYQFYYLAPERTEYYDFNDVIINLIGGVFGLLIIRGLRRKSYRYTYKTFFKSKHFLILLSILLFIIGLFATGLLVKNYNPNNLDAKFWLIREPVSQFWKFERQYNLKFHIVQPWEGVLIIASLILLYSKLYKGVPLLNKD